MNVFVATSGSKLKKKKKKSCFFFSFFGYNGRGKRITNLLYSDLNIDIILQCWVHPYYADSKREEKAFTEDIHWFLITAWLKEHS